MARASAITTYFRGIQYYGRPQISRSCRMHWWKSHPHLQAPRCRWEKIFQQDAVPQCHPTGNMQGKPAIHWCQCGLPWMHAWCQCLPQVQSVQQRLGSNRWISQFRRCCISTATLAPYTIQGSWKSVPSPGQLQCRPCIKVAGHWVSLWSLEEKVHKIEVGHRHYGHGWNKWNHVCLCPTQYLLPRKWPTL